MTRIDDRARTRDIAASGGPRAWRGIDFVTLAVLGVGFGVVFWGWNTFLYPLFTAAVVFPPAQSLALGVWLLPAVVGGLIVRRPGAALYTELLAATVEMLIGNQWGTAVMVSALMQGLGVEIAFALFAWRRYGVFFAMLAGAFAAILELLGWEWWAYMPEYDMIWKLMALGFAVTSGIIVAGIGGWLLVRALAAAGALGAFPPGREHAARTAR